MMLRGMVRWLTNFAAAVLGVAVVAVAAAVVVVVVIVHEWPSRQLPIRTRIQSPKTLSTRREAAKKKNTPNHMRSMCDHG